MRPASGQATKMNGIGSSASSEFWFQPNCTNLIPYQRKTSAITRTNRLDTIRSSAFARGFISGQRSTSKCALSRMPTIAPIMIIQTKKKRAISSVQM